MSTSTGEVPGGSDPRGSIADNTESHDDRVDSASDVAWAQSEVGAGRSALRVLMTDAPLDADNVFVTICGIHVHALGTAEPGTALPDARDPRGAGGAGGADGGSRDGRAEPGAAGAGAGGAGGDGAGGDRAEAPEASEDPEKSEVPDADYAAADDGAVPSEDAASDEADEGDEADEADEAEKDDAERAGDPPIDQRPSEQQPIDGRDPAQVPPVDREGAAPGEPHGNWLAVSEQCQTLDLLTLRDGVTEAVGVAALPPGHYGQIRLLIVDASVVVQGVEHPLTIPSGSESGVKINGGFSLFEGEATTITLDFDAGQSVHFVPESGYMMRPVISLIDVADHFAAPGAGGDRGGADPGVAGAAGRDGAGAGGSGSADAPRGEAPPRPPIPGEDPASRPAPSRPGDEPPPPPPGAGGDGAGGAPSHAEPSEEEPEAAE